MLFPSFKSTIYFRKETNFDTNDFMCNLQPMQPTVLLIVNPYSGKKNGGKQSTYISRQLETKGFRSEIFLSESTAALQLFVQQTNMNIYHSIGILGGDGTMHEFLNALFSTTDYLTTPVALFPCGTGNAFNFDIGCSTVDETIRCILNNKISAIDIAEVKYAEQTLWSFNIIGCGLVADINAMAERMRWLGSSRYTIASLIQLLKNRTVQAEIITEETTITERISFVLACNTRYTGKGMMMAPLAQLHDGKFDVLVVKASSRLTLLKLFPKIFKGGHMGSDILHYIQSSTLSVKCFETTEMTNIDGEMKGQAPFSFRVHKNKVRVYTN